MNRISNTGDKGRRGFKEAGQALGWLKNKYKGWDRRKKGDWSQTLASVFNAQILVCVYLTVFLKFLIYHRIFPSKRKITCITDFEIDFTNCTRKPFLNLVSFIKNIISTERGQTDKWVNWLDVLKMVTQRQWWRKLSMPLPACFNSI